MISSSVDLSQNPTDPPKKPFDNYGVSVNFTQFCQRCRASKLLCNTVSGDLNNESILHLNNNPLIII